MNRKRILRKVASLALCLTLTLPLFGAVVPDARAANGNGTVYTFGDASGPWRDLAAEHQKEAKQREKERKKAERKQAMREKAAMKKAAREAREREKKEKAAKKNAEKGANQT